MNTILGKYVRIKLSGKFGVVCGSFVLETISGPVTYYNVNLNNFSTTTATLDEMEIIY